MIFWRKLWIVQWRQVCSLMTKNVHGSLHLKNGLLILTITVQFLFYFLLVKWITARQFTIVFMSINYRWCNLINENSQGLDLSIHARLPSTAFFKKWLRNIYNGKLTCVLFVDLSKAFDTINHNVLLHKLLSFGICNNTVNWF